MRCWVTGLSSINSCPVGLITVKVRKSICHKNVSFHLKRDDQKKDMGSSEDDSEEGNDNFGSKKMKRK